MTAAPPQMEPMPEQLPELLLTIDGTLVVPTEDDILANVAFDGFRYLSALEFARRHPALALLYELDFERLGTRGGSRLIDFRIFVRARDRVRAEMDKAGSVAVLAVVLALPGALNDGITLWSQLFAAVEAQLQHDLPQAPAHIDFTIHPAPEKPAPFRGHGQSFNL